jgi:hypothetical protein
MNVGPPTLSLKQKRRMPGRLLPSFFLKEGGALRVTPQLVRFPVVALVLWLLSGCATTGVQPWQFQFVTTVEKSEPGADGWREACIHALVENMTTRDAFICKIGIGMPIQTQRSGYITTREAQSLAADCANRAAERAIQPATATTPSALVCQSFKNTYQALLSDVVLGSRVKLECHPKTTPVKIGF